MVGRPSKRHEWGGWLLDEAEQLGPGPIRLEIVDHDECHHEKTRGENAYWIRINRHHHKRKLFITLVSSVLDNEVNHKKQLFKDGGDDRLELQTLNSCNKNA